MNFSFVLRLGLEIFTVGGAPAISVKRKEI